MPSALLISNSADIHTDLLVRAAGESCVPFFRLNTDHFRRDGDIRLHFSSDRVEGELHYRQKSVNLRDVALVVYRRPERAYEDDGAAPAWATWIVDQEWKRVDEVLSMVSPAVVLNPVDASAVARNKLAQLIHAARAGLQIPSSLVTTSKGDFKSFLKEWDPAVTKGISASYVLDGEIVRTGFTMTIQPAEKSHDPQGCPTLLQQRVPATAVWRIVAVGGTIFGVRYTGSALRDATDARLVHDRLIGEPQNVPDDVSRGLHQMCKTIGVSFSSSDFLETAGGELVFLDLNPDGQWAWLQIEFGVPIAKEIISLALSHEHGERDVDAEQADADGRPLRGRR